MDSSDLVALIALIVSLVALGIALLQLLQSSALTAEGWRQCNATNLGPWSVFSRRKWLWSELRCEVLFTTPAISLMDTSTLQRTTEFEPSIFIEADKLKVGQQSKDRLVFEQASKFSRPETSLARAASHILGFGTLPNKIEQGWLDENASADDGAKPLYTSRWSRTTSLFEPRDFVQSCLRWMRGYHFRYLPQHLSYQNRDSIAITWNSFLREIYNRQHTTMHKRPEDPIGNEVFIHEPQGGYTLFPQSSTSTTKEDMRNRLRKAETIVCLDLQRNSWDFLPPDVVRPLASSTISTVVILARRLGMEWKTFDISTELFRAEGNGCTLSATRVRGLGIVFRFDTSRRILEGESPLCTEEADMAYFGIVPGEGRLGIPDFSLVDDKGTLEVDAFVKSEFGEEPKRLRDKLYFWGRVIPNDAVALLCPFMPLRRSPVPEVYTAMGTQNRLDIFAKVSIFRAIGMNGALRARLNEQILAIRLKKSLRPVSMQPNEGTKFEDPVSKADDIYLEDSQMHIQSQFFDPKLEKATIDTTLQELFINHQELKTRISKVKGGRMNVSYLSTAEDDLEVRVYSVKKDDPSKKYFRERIASNPGTWQTDHLHAIHNMTTEYFEAYMPRNTSNRIEKPTATVVSFKYVVQAYMTLVSHCILEWYEKNDERGGQKKATNHADGDLSDGWGTLLHFCNLLFLPENLQRFREFLRKALPGDTIISEEALEDFFWMTVARGVAWQLSVNVLRTDSRTMVPSSVYGSKMPVWIE